MQTHKWTQVTGTIIATFNYRKLTYSPLHYLYKIKSEIMRNTVIKITFNILYTKRAQVAQTNIATCDYKYVT